MIGLCLTYIERLCIPFQKLEGINDYIKKQEDLLLSWNKKIEDAKQRAELESFLKTIDKQLTKFEKEKQIREKKASQKKRQDAKIEKVVSLLKKTSEIEMYEREILLVKDYDYIVESITNSKQILLVTQATIDKLNKFIDEYKGNNINTQKTTNLVKIEDEKRKLELTNLDLEELEGKKTQIEQILNRENVGKPTIGIRNLEDRLKENIKAIEDKQAAEAAAAEAAAVAEASLAEAATGPAVVEANVKRGLGLEAPASEAPASEALNANKTATNLSRAAASAPLSEKNTANSLERAANSAKPL
jgi:DNA repair exonuclease SbcCD ATPase subunit